MQVVRIGLDIAKSNFQVHGVDAHGKVVIRKHLTRGKVLSYFAQLPSCFVGLEAYGGAHYWARELQPLGHDARLMAVQLIKPYRTKQKNDRNDAEAHLRSRLSAAEALCPDQDGGAASGVDRASRPGVAGE